MSETKTKKENPISNEKVIYTDEKARFKIISYDFTIQDGKDKGKVLNLVKLAKAKNVFSKEFNTYVEVDNYVTLSADSFNSLVTAIKETPEEK
ncbi:MAG: hypothetical protein N4A38_03850 [Candidatus Gracilibacteria bacterium]|nr:hypothetical protein [Candidatus Gracilibacteria bacterium]